MIKIFLEVNNCPLYHGSMNIRLTVHFNFVNDIKLSSPIYDLMEEFGVVNIIHNPM